MIEDLIITWWNQIWDTLEASYTRIWTWTEWATQYQWYFNWEAIEWANSNEYQALQSWKYIVAVLPVDSEWNEWDIVYSDEYEVEDFKKDEPIQKEFLVKTYDKNFVFVKVIPMSIITNDISFSENIDWWQWQLVLNLNLPLATDYLDNIKYLKVFVSDDSWLNDHLLYTWYLSQFTRQFSNDSENIQATFLSLFSLFSEIYYKDWSWNTEFTITWTRAEIIKWIVDYVNESYNLFTYTNDTIIDDWVEINVECSDTKCLELLKKVVDWTTYHLFVWADWVVKFKPKPTDISHYFTYEKDVSALMIPEDFEQVVNAVRVQYWYIWWPHSWITERAEDTESISRFWRKEQTIVNENIYWVDSANQYRDEYLAKYSSWKQNITLVVNSLYQIENIHPWNTIKIRNLDLEISWLQVNTVKYQYKQATLQLEYTSSLAQEIFSSNS